MSAAVGYCTVLFLVLVGVILDLVFKIDLIKHRVERIEKTVERIEKTYGSGEKIG